MSDCSKYRALICELLDEQLNNDDRAALLAHIADCPECRSMYFAFSAVSDAISEYTEDIPEGLHENIMAGVRRSAIKNNSKKYSKKQLKGLLMAAACFAVVIMSAVGISRSLPSRQSGVITDRAQLAAFDALPTAEEAAEVSSAPEARAEITAAPSVEPTAPARSVIYATPAVPDETADPRDNEYYSEAPRESSSTQTPPPIFTPVPTVAPTAVPSEAPAAIPSVSPSAAPASAPVSGGTDSQPLQEEQDNAQSAVQREDASESVPTAQNDEQAQAQGAAAASAPEAAQEAEKAADSSAAVTAEQAAAETPEVVAVQPKKASLFSIIRDSFSAMTASETESASAAVTEESGAAASDNSGETEELSPEQTVPPLLDYVTALGDDDKSEDAPVEDAKKAKADFLADITSAKDFELFAKQLIGPISKLPEGKPDKTYLFSTTYLDKIKNFDIIVYAYGDSMYYCVYDEVFEQNVYLADCKMKDFEAFIKLNYPQPEASAQPDSAALSNESDGFADIQSTPDPAYGSEVSYESTASPFIS